MAYPVLFGLIVLLKPAQAIQTCTSLDRLKGVVEGKMLPDSQMTNLTMPKIMTCSRACLARRRCKSFNFNMKSGDCQLNSRTNNSAAPLKEFDDFVFSDIIHWPELLSGVCASHKCPLNSYCNPVNKTDFVCKVTGCLDLPAVENGHFDSHPDESHIGTAMTLKCNIGYMPNTEVICQDDGMWTSVVCVSASSCSTVKNCRSDSADGEYWLRLTNFDNYTTKIYCYHMSSTSPQEFLTLPNINYGIYPIKSNENCNGEVNELKHDCVDRGGEVWFNKIMVNISTMEVYIEDKTFANFTRQEIYLQYGLAYDCYTNTPEQCGTRGNFSIDLRGTGWKVDENQEWETFGSEPKLTDIDKKMNGTVITVKCGGWAGGCRPVGGLFLKPSNQT